MTTETILVIEDEEDILDLIVYNLEKEGYGTVRSTNGENALLKLNSLKPGMILLDIMLPGINGLEVCKMIKSNSKTERIPIIMLTAKSEEADVITGLDMGADDYFVKPFSPKILIARVKALLRSRNYIDTSKEKLIQSGKLMIDPGRREVFWDEELIELTYSEFSILLLLAGKPGWVYSRDDIVTHVHGDNYPVTDRSVDVQISSLRKKLKMGGDFIEAVRGVGYRYKNLK